MGFLLGNPQLSVITVCIAVVLFLVGWWKSGLRGIESIFNEILNLFFVSFSVATAIVLALTVSITLVAPTLLQDPQGALYSAGILGAVVLLIWAFAVFWRQVAVLRLKTKPAIVPSTTPPIKATGTGTISARASVTVLPPVPEAIRQFIPKIQDWVRLKVPDARNWNFTNIYPVSDFIEFTGTIYDSIMLPYTFKVRTTKNGEVVTNQSWVK